MPALTKVTTRRLYPAEEKQEEFLRFEKEIRENAGKGKLLLMKL